MKNLRQLAALFCLFALALPACRPPAEEDAEIVVTAAPEFRVDLFTEYAAADGAARFGLWVQSVGTYACANYRIAYATEADGMRLQVRLLGVEAPASCQGSAGQARAFVPLGPLAPGDYDFSLSLGDALVSRGVLQVSEERYQLRMDTKQGVDFQELLLQKIPPGLVWGFVDTPNAEAKSAGLNFLTELKNISEEAGLQPGFYGYFTLSGTGLVTLHPSLEAFAPHEPFLRRLNSGTATLSALLQQYRNAPAQAIGIRCLSTFGEL